MALNVNFQDVKKY